MKNAMQWIAGLLLLCCCASVHAGFLQRIPDNVMLPEQATTPEDVTLPDPMNMGDNASSWAKEASSWAKELVDTSIIRDGDDPKLTLASSVNATLIDVLSDVGDPPGDHGPWSGLTQAAERLGQVGPDNESGGGAFSTEAYSTSTGYSVSTTVVPIPAAAWLFGSALGLLGWIRHKKAS